MDLTQLTSSTLSKIAKLLKRKEALLDRAAKVDRAIAAVAAIPGAVVGAARKKRTMSAAGRKAVAAAQRKRWAKIKAKKAGKGNQTEKPEGARKISPVSAKLIAAVKDAGTKGISVPDLAKKTGMKIVNIRAWVKTTALNLGVKKVSRGVYAL